MSAIQIAGGSGAGKSAVAAELARRGLTSVDTDDDPLLARLLAGRFTQVFLLEIDEPTMLARLDARRDYHDWGHIGDTREYLCRKLPALQDRLRASGAIPVDAKPPLDQVVDALLCRMLPVPLTSQADSPGPGARGR